jgi:hypothetical protein
LTEILVGGLARSGVMTHAALKSRGRRPFVLRCCDAESGWPGLAALSYS